ncbi:hypothetical protein ACFQVC_00075 [Streptomyces monticola]|uniref:Uncharacterized protein n=1 Tax=Streptomyces monticola TaxID=2666263 RepID=A0ABW2JAB5_9ACTN
MRGALGVVLALVVGALWWWAVLRLALVPESAGVVEGTVAAGGWGLSLLPVHCVPWSQAVGARRRARQEAGRCHAEIKQWRAGFRRVATRAWRRRRWGGGSGRS